MDNWVYIWVSPIQKFKIVCEYKVNVKWRQYKYWSSTFMFLFCLNSKILSIMIQNFKWRFVQYEDGVSGAHSIGMGLYHSSFWTGINFGFCCLVGADSRGQLRRAAGWRKWLAYPMYLSGVPEGYLTLHASDTRQPPILPKSRPNEWWCCSVKPRLQRIKYPESDKPHLSLSKTHWSEFGHGSPYSYRAPRYPGKLPHWRCVSLNGAYMCHQHHLLKGRVCFLSW